MMGFLRCGCCCAVFAAGVAACVKGRAGCGCFRAGLNGVVRLQILSLFLLLPRGISRTFSPDAGRERSLSK